MICFLLIYFTVSVAKQIHSSSKRKLVWQQLIQIVFCVMAVCILGGNKGTSYHSLHPIVFSLNPSFLDIFRGDHVGRWNRVVILLNCTDRIQDTFFSRINYFKRSVGISSFSLKKTTAGECLKTDKKKTGEVNHSGSNLVLSSPSGKKKKRKPHTNKDKEIKSLKMLKTDTSFKMSGCRAGWGMGVGG